MHALPSEHALPVVGPQSPLVAAPAATEQAWQSLAPPPQAELQQTPSTQKPLSHPVAAVQEAPRAAALASTVTRASGAVVASRGAAAPASALLKASAVSGLEGHPAAKRSAKGRLRRSVLRMLRGYVPQGLTPSHVPLTGVVVARAHRALRRRHEASFLMSCA